MKKDILDIIDHRSGETVPEGYFDSFRSRMKLELPERRWEYDGESVDEAKGGRKLWTKLRPYVYMAAMFAGVWLMMNMFTLFQPARTGEIEDSPTLLAALANDGFVNEYIAPDVDEYELMDDLYESGFDPSTVGEWTDNQESN